MTVGSRSRLAWLAGAVVGIAVARKRKVLGALAGAVVIGGIADAMIERGEWMAAA